jgi:hypothetical protein
MVPAAARCFPNPLMIRKYAPIASKTQAFSRTQFVRVDLCENELSLDRKTVQP